MRTIKLLWDRLNCICGWPLLYLVDLGIAWSGVQTWEESRAFSTGAILKIWNRHSLKEQEPQARK